MIHRFSIICLAEHRPVPRAAAPQEVAQVPVGRELHDDVERPVLRAAAEQVDDVDMLADHLHHLHLRDQRHHLRVRVALWKWGSWGYSGPKYNFIHVYLYCLFNLWR